MVQFGHHLKAARLESGLTQADVANRLGVSKGYISRLESGKARPAETTVRRLAQLCATDPDPLLILAGYLPPDLRAILAQHPTEAAAVLRATFGRTDLPHNTPPAVAKSQVPTSLARPRINSLRRIVSRGWNAAPPTASTPSSPIRPTA